MSSNKTIETNSNLLAKVMFENIVSYQKYLATLIFFLVVQCVNKFIMYALLGCSEVPLDLFILTENHTTNTF